MNNVATQILLETADGYFLANLDNGGICVGLKNDLRFDFPAGHIKFAACAALNSENIEVAYDELVCGHINEWGTA